MGRNVARVIQHIKEQLGPVDPRWELADRLARLLPSSRMGRWRALVYRAIGARQIDSHVHIAGPLEVLSSPEKLVIRGTAECPTYINRQLTVNPRGGVIIEAGVAIGPQVLIDTTGHNIGHPAMRGLDLTAREIRIGKGAWIGARAQIHASVGAGSIIGAGAVVVQDVPENVLSAGVPAVVKRRL